MQRTTVSARSLKHDIKRIWFMCATGCLLPVYFNGTRSQLLHLVGTTLTRQNSQWFSVGATAILLPIAYGWKAGRTIGAAVQFGIFGALVLWLTLFDPAVLADWLSYIGKLAVVCAATASIVTLILWAAAARNQRQNPS